MLGSRDEAEDAVQDVWLDLNHADVGAIDNLGRWLTTVVARGCLDRLRARRSRREYRLGLSVPMRLAVSEHGIDPALETLVADSVGLALLVVLDKLDPAERVAFVLHDIFDLPFDEIAPILARTPSAARQLASRARRRVRESSLPDTDFVRQRDVVDAFLAAARGGDFDALVELLDPDAVLRRMARLYGLARQGRFAARPPWPRRSPHATVTRSLPC
jgi:RNA polymerase sigma factor (sigma-70 family)